MHGRAVNAMTESIDVMPTILDRIGAAIPHSVNGQSLLPSLDDVDTAARAATMSEVDLGDPVKPTEWMSKLGLAARDAHLVVLRTDRHRLVHFGGNLPQILFDMNDEGELLDKSTDPDAVSTCLDLSRQLLSHRMRTPEGTFARTMVGQGVHTGDL